MLFEWDPAKDAFNQRKHGVSFTEAREVFDDPLHLSLLDKRFDYFEERWITIGQSSGRRILVVATLSFDDDGEETVRIISAREATSNENRQYEELF